MMKTHEPRTASQLFGPPVPPESTRERLIHIALNLFFENGFHAVGLDRVLAEVGVTKTTFYNHFESKDHLIVEALIRRDEWDQRFYKELIVERGGPDPAAQLLAVFDVLHDYFNEEKYFGCMFINACAEFPLPADPVHQAAAEHYRKEFEHLRVLAQQAGLRDPAKIAQQWLILMQGAFSQRLVMGDNDAARSAKLIAQRLIEDASVEVSD